MGKDLISIIITSYRRPEMIENAVLNCLNQSYENIEVIVIDDNGLNTPCQIETENTMQGFSGNEKVRYIPLDRNKGSSAARNFGAGQSRGTYLAFFDDDDEWTAEKIELQYKAIRTSPNEPAIVFCSQKIVDVGTLREYMHIDYATLLQNPYDKLLNTSISFATPNPLIRKTAFLEAGGFKAGLPSAQDLELGLRITRNHDIAVIDDICLISKVHPGERISTNHKGKIQGFKYILDNYDTDLSETGRIHYWQRILMHCFYGKIEKEAEESMAQLKKLNAFSMKYRCFYQGIKNRLLRILLNKYLSISNALYKNLV